MQSTDKSASTALSAATVWLLRLLLALALAYGGEVLLWTNPPGRTLPDIGLLAVGYLAIATLLLDIFARYRVRDFWGVMLLAGLYGLLNGLLLNPQTALYDVPRTLITRTMGAHTLLGLEMLVLFITLLDGRTTRRRWILLVGSLAVGLAWGVWVGLSPLQTDVNYGIVPLETMLIVGIGGIILLCGLYLLTVYRIRGATFTPDAFVLPLGGLLGLLLILAVLFFIRVLQNQLVGVSVVMVAIVLGLTFAILWNRKNTKLPTYSENLSPIAPLSPLWLILSALFVLATGIFAYNLPIIGTTDLNQLSVVVFGFTLYGLSWLPFVSLVLGVRAYIRQIASKPL